MSAQEQALREAEQELLLCIAQGLIFAVDRCGGSADMLINAQDEYRAALASVQQEAGRS